MSSLGNQPLRLVQHNRTATDQLYANRSYGQITGAFLYQRRERNRTASIAQFFRATISGEVGRIGKPLVQYVAKRAEFHARIAWIVIRDFAKSPHFLTCNPGHSRHSRDDRSPT